MKIQERPLHSTRQGGVAEDDAQARKAGGAPAPAFPARAVTLALSWSSGGYTSEVVLGSCDSDFGWRSSACSST